MEPIVKDNQYYKFCLYGFLKNLRFFDAFFILFLLSKEINYGEIGILYALREVTINLFEIPSGIVADTYGRKRALMGSFIFYIISFTIFYWGSHLLPYAIAFVFFGIAEAFRSGTHKGMIMEYLKQQHQQHQKIAYYGSTRSCSQTGSAISALLAGILVFFSGNYNYIFLFSIIPYLLNILNIASYPKSLNFSTDSKTKKHREYSVKITFLNLIHTLKSAKTFRLINTSALHSAYLKSVKDYVQPLMVAVIVMIPYLNHIETSKKTGLFVGIFYFIIYYISSIASRWASKAVNNKYNIVFISLLLGLAAGLISGIFYNFHLLVIALITFIAIYLIENLRKPILTGYIADNVGNKVLTSVMSAQSQLKTIMVAVFSIVLGFLIQHLGMGTAMIILSASLILFGISIEYWPKKSK